MRAFVLVLLICLTACTPAASSPSASPSSATSVTPTPTATPTPSAAPSQTSAPVGTPIPLPTSAQVAAAGNGVVWMLVADTHLFRSTDRGTTWTERTVPAGAGQIEVAFVSDLNGFAMRLGSPATQCQAQSVTTFRTTDGAATWQPVGASFDTVGCKSSLAFVDAQHGFMSGSDPNHAPSIWRTSDGGASWLAAQLPDPPGFTTQNTISLRPGPVADFGIVLFVSAVGLSGGSDKRYVFRSTDAGATWSFVASAPDAQSGLVFLTGTRWIQISSPGASMETTNTGASWHAFTTDYQQAAPVAPQIAFGDANTGYATVRGGLSRTTDGGAHWTTLKTPGT